MTHIISFINFKGGVGKTTTLIQVAETLATIHEKRVLVLDLDPQTNATVVLIGETRWQTANNDKQTLAHLFLDKLNSTHEFDISRALIKGVSNLDKRSKGTIDLIPSSIELVDIQDRMADVGTRTSYTMAPMEVIRLELGSLFADYDFVLIDCPPNLGYITQNGLEVSDYYLIPVVPDVLSTYGLPQIIKRIQQHADKRRLRVRSLGVVVTKYDSRRQLHQDTVKLLPTQLSGYYTSAKAAPAKLFETIIPQANRYSEVMDFNATPVSFKDKWGTGTSGNHQLHHYPQALAYEILNRL